MCYSITRTGASVIRRNGGSKSLAKIVATKALRDAITDNSSNGLEKNECTAIGRDPESVTNQEREKTSIPYSKVM